MRIVFGVLLIVLGLLCAIPGIELIYNAWNLPAHAPSPVSIAGIALGHRQACALFLVPGTILIVSGLALAISNRPSV